MHQCSILIRPRCTRSLRFTETTLIHGWMHARIKNYFTRHRKKSIGKFVFILVLYFFLTLFFAIILLFSFIQAYYSCNTPIAGVLLLQGYYSCNTPGTHWETSVAQSRYCHKYWWLGWKDPSQDAGLVFWNDLLNSSAFSLVCLVFSDELNLPSMGITSSSQWVRQMKNHAVIHLAPICP